MGEALSETVLDQVSKAAASNSVKIEELQGWAKLHHRQILKDGKALARIDGLLGDIAKQLDRMAEAQNALTRVVEGLAGERK